MFQCIDTYKNTKTVRFSFRNHVRFSSHAIATGRVLFGNVSHVIKMTNKAGVEPLNKSFLKESRSFLV